MRILHTTAEFYPFIKAGGLSDMLSSLARAQSEENEVFVAIPYLKTITEKIEFTGNKQPCISEEDFHFSDSSVLLRNSEFLEAKYGKVTLYFFKSPIFDNYEFIYGNTDECYTFALFSYSCYNLGKILNADIVHSHDWHTALTSVLNSTKKGGKATCFTIHNLAYQGDHPFWMTAFLRSDPFDMDQTILAHFEKVNYMKGALEFADEITTVSPGYKEETLHEPAGRYLSWLLKRRGESYTGILNGIDSDEWNPNQDKKIYHTYDLNNVEKGKNINKYELYKEYGLHVDLKRPVIGLISRLTFQKGFDTFLHAFKEKWNLPFYYIILGTGDKHIEGALFHESHHSHQRLFFYKGFSEPLARKIEAASDFFLMPSLFEPCGLNQLYSHAYGSIPIVSRVGGLKDSVQEFPEDENKTGIVFEPGDVASLNFALERANTLYKNKPALEKVRKNIMSLDWSWKKRKIEYNKVYARALEKKHANHSKK